ncbi:MAG TPA: DUF2071 domain-containing protein [Streptosporangiaceae bacterium]|nr:DUF2071 domain-containing protein [Streptosporangiaceae bacterium]
MRQPRLASVIERRILVNYRIDPAIIAPMLPALLRPQEVSGWAVAGICLIRLGKVRPSWVPGGFGLRSENAAHRIAVEWDGPDGPETGVYIPRRDSSSVVNVLAGGRLFPGEHHRAAFKVHETAHDLHVAYNSHDGVTRVSVDARVATTLQGSAVFADLEQASAFFQHGSTGFSGACDGSRLDGMALDTDAWQVEPLEVRAVRSSFFDDQNRFPQDSAVLDSALLMRDVPVTWKPLRPMQVSSTPSRLLSGNTAHSE